MFSPDFFSLQLLLVLIRLWQSSADTSEQYDIDYNGWNQTHSPHRIVGGEAITVRRAPWQVALISRGQFICGGSIISRRWILTAAHCVTGRGPYSIRAGTRYFKSGGSTRRVVNVVPHRRYNRQTTQYDIAMLRLNSPLKFSRRVMPIRLAGRRSKLPRYFYVSGWGAIGERSSVVSRGLRRARLAFVPKSRCVRSYRGKVRIMPKTICSSSPGKDSCFGDSGGPLVSRNRQYGIVSFGIGCARRRYPGVYTDVRSYRQWIRYVARHY